MPDIDIRLVIEAQNAASSEIVNLRRDLDRLKDPIDDVGKRSTQSFSQTGRQVRLLAGEISSELSPALGNVVLRATSASGAVQGMSGALTAGVVAATLAAAALGAYIRNLNESAERQAAVNLAVRSFDTGPLRAQLQAATQEMEKQSIVANTYIGYLEKRLRGLTDALGFTTAAQQKLTEAQAGLGKLVGIERQSALAEVYGKQQEALQALLTVEQQRAVAGGGITAILQLNERLEQSIVNQAAAEGRLLDIERLRAIEAAKTRQEPQANIDAIEARYRGLQTALGARTLARVEAQRAAGTEAVIGIQSRIGLEGLEDYGRAEGVGAGIPVDSVAYERALQAVFQSMAREFFGREAAPEPGIEDYGEREGAGLDQAGRDAIARGRQAVSDVDLASFERRNQLAVEYASILERQNGLTLDQQAALTQQRIEIEAAAVQASRQLTDDQKRVELLKLQVEQANLLRSELERTDATAGLGAGFQDVADEVQSAGARMREGLVTAFHDINRSFGDIVVAGITGQGAKLSDIGRQLGLNLLRGIIDQISTRAIGSVFQGLSGYLPTGRGIAGTVGAVAIAGSAVAPAGVGAGTIVPTVTGVGRVTATGTIQPVSSTAGSPAYGQGGDVVAGGGGGGVGLPLTGLGSLTPTTEGGGGFLSGFFGPSVSLYDAAVAYQAGGLAGVAAVQSGQAVIVSGELVYTAGNAAAVGALEGGGAAAAGATGTSSSAAGAGAAAGAVFGSVLAAAALAYSAYSAYQAGAAGDRYAAASGAVTGAVAGAVLGSIYPGIGTVVGAVAGAAIGGGAGAAGKSEHGPSHAEREQRETRDVQNAVSGFQGAVAGAGSLDVLYDVLLDYSHASYGGGQPSVSPETAGFRFSFVLDDEPYVVGRRKPRGVSYSMADVGVFRLWALSGDLATFRAQIQAGIAAVESINGPAQQVVVDKITSLREQELRGLIAYQESFNAPGVAGTAVSRLTVLPSSRASEAEGKQILFSRDELLLAGFDDDMIEQFIRRIAKVDLDRNLGAINAPHLVF